MRICGINISYRSSKVSNLLGCLVLISVVLLASKNLLYQQEHEPATLKPEEKDFENVKMKCINGSTHDVLEENKVTEPHYSTLNEVVEVAKAIGAKHKTILVSVINDGFIPFVFSWLCNTKDMNIHTSVLVITTDMQTVKVLRRDWPNVNAVAIELNVPSGNQKYSRVGYVKIMVKRAEILLEILKTGVNFMLTEFDYVWFENAVPKIESMTGVDILKNPVSKFNNQISNGGLIYTFATKKSIKLWEELVIMMKKTWVKIENMANDQEVPESENDQIFLSKLIRERYADILVGDLPLESYADGVWYSMSESERNKTKPVMISNNWIIGKVFHTLTDDGTSTFAKSVTVTVVLLLIVLKLSTFLRWKLLKLPTKSGK